MNLIGVGSKVLSVAAVALVVGLILFSMTQSVKKNTEDSITIELQEKQNEKAEKVRSGVDAGRNSSVNDSLQYLQSR